MSNFDAYSLELLADSFAAAASSENPTNPIIAMLSEFEGQVHDRALNDVCKNFHKHSLPGVELIRNMQLSTAYGNACSHRSIVSKYSPEDTDLIRGSLN